MIVTEYKGQAGLNGVWGTMTSAKGFDSIALHPPSDADYILHFTSGGTGTIGVGETITGATSAATAVVVGVVLNSGTWGAGTAAGTFFLRTKTGTFQAEEINTNQGTVAQDAAKFHSAGQQAKAALITCETASAKFTLTGTLPTATAGTNLGHVIAAAQNYTVSGIQDLKNFKAINETNANGSIIQYTIFY